LESGVPVAIVMQSPTMIRVPRWKWYLGRGQSSLFPVRLTPLSLSAIQIPAHGHI